MKRFELNLFWKLSFLSAFLFLSVHSATVTKTYQASEEVFCNPERGVWKSIMIGLYSDISTVMKAERSNYKTVCQAYFRPEGYKTGPLPQSYLDLVQAIFDQARSAGVKVAPRWSYTFDYPNGVDPQLSVILGHLQQLKPIFARNSDVFDILDCGFFGPWGEQHTTAIAKDPTSVCTILKAILETVPSDRMCTVRYNTLKRSCLKSDVPVSRTEAFNRTDRARVGHINDCFLANGINGGDMGTYDNIWGDVLSRSIENQKIFLSKDNVYVPQSGESCGSCGCTAAQAFAEFKRMKWDAIDDNNTNVIPIIKANPTDWATFNKLLGYRFQVMQAVIPDSIKPGCLFQVKLTVKNVGWGKAFNARKPELILKNHQNSSDVWYAVTSADCRFWSPDSTITEVLEGGIPASGMANGAYDLYVNLPDTASRLHNDPRYSIQLANLNMWDATSGYNSLQQSVVISNSASGQQYTGPAKFIKVGQPWPIRNLNPAWVIPASDLLEVSQLPSNLSKIKIAFQLQKAGPVSLRIMDLQGKSLIHSEFMGKRYEARIDMGEFGAGLFLVELNTQNNRLTKRMLCMR